MAATFLSSARNAPSATIIDITSQYNVTKIRFSAKSAGIFSLASLSIILIYELLLVYYRFIVICVTNLKIVRNAKLIFNETANKCHISSF